jgi:tRNA threonylcarbamoyladenosine biosynthesis protein TsaE
VASPTFTISKQYRSSKLTVYHFDFYRLNEAGIVRDELAELLGDKDVVIVIEWGGLVEDVLPPMRLKVNLIVRGEDSRELEFICPETLGYLVEGIK